MHVLEPSWPRFWEKIRLSWRMLTRPTGWANYHVYKRIKCLAKRYNKKIKRDVSKQALIFIPKRQSENRNSHLVYCNWTRNMIIGFGCFRPKFSCTLPRRRPIWNRWLWTGFKDSPLDWSSFLVNFFSARLQTPNYSYKREDFKSEQ